MSYYMGVDLGGTTIGMGLLNEKRKLAIKANVRTPKKPSKGQLVSTLITEITNFLRENNIALSQIRCIGMGVPGQVSAGYDTMLQATNLGLENVELKALLEPSLRTPLYICNDADAAAYGEAKAGSAKGHHKSITVTIGTGIGTGIIIGSEILPSEGGHMAIVHEGEPCGCGRLGCFEQYASTTALVRQTEAAMRENPTSKLHRLVEENNGYISGKTVFLAMEQGDKTARAALVRQTEAAMRENPTSKLHRLVEENNGYISGKTVFLAMEQGDKTARAVFDRYIRYLGSGLTSLANVLMPDIICLSGGISMQGEKLTKPLNKYLAERQYPLPNGSHSQVVQCILGSDAGIIGAALISMQGEKLTKPLNKYLAERQYPLPNGSHSQVVQCILGSDAGIIGAALFALDRHSTALS